MYRNPIPCAHCGARSIYKHSIGAHKCASCGGLTRTNGAAIGTPKRK
jgi:hypothetical protein